MTSITEKLKPKTTTRTSAEILEDIQSVPIEMRIARSVAIGTDLEAAEHERGCVICLTNHNGGETSIDDPQSMRGKYMNLGANLSKAAGLRFLADTLAKNETVIEARAILDPLFLELATAKENERIEAAKAAQAAQDLRDAQAAARAELESKLDQHPAVVEAAKKLEPFRRLGELVKP
jgi:hypothetical protein